MAKDDITVQIGIATKNAIKDLGKFSKAASSSIKSVTDSVFTLKNAFIGAFAAAGVSKALSAVTSAAIRQEDAVNSLNTALKTSGQFSEDASKDLQKFATQLQKTTKFGDELIIEQIALAKAFGATNEQAKQVTEAAIELAAATGKSLEEATRQVSKTLGGFAGELGEVNPAIKALTAEQLKAGAAAKILIEQYGGSASGQLNTFSGATAQLSNTFGDLLEEVGFLITKNPAVIEAVKDLNKFFGELIGIVQDNSKEIKEFVSSALKGLISTLKSVITSFKSLSKTLSKIDFEDVAQSVTNIAIAFGSLTAAIKVSSLVQAGAALGAFKSAGDFAAGVSLLSESLGSTKILKSAGAFALAAGKIVLIAGAAAAAALAVDLLIRNFDNLGPAISQAVNLEEIDTIEDRINDLNELIRTGTQTGASAGPAGQSGFRVISRDDEESIARYKEEIAELTTELAVLKGESDKTGEKLRENFDPGPILGPLLEKFGIFSKDLEESIPPIKIDTEFVGPPAPPDLGVQELALPGAQNPEQAKALKAELAARAKADADAAKEAARRSAILASTISGAVAGLSKGAEGAADFLSAGVSGVTEVLLPGFGGIAGQIFDLLAAGPDAITEMVEGLVGAIPQVLTNVALAIPALITSLISNIDEFVIGIAKAAPQIIRALTIELVIQLTNPALWTDVAIALVEALASEITGVSIGFDQEKLQQIFDNFTGDFSKAFDNLLPNIDESIKNAAADFANFFKTGLGEEIGNLTSAIEDPFDKIFKKFDAFGKEVSKIFGGFGSGFTDLFKGISTIFGGDLKKFLDPLGIFPNSIREALDPLDVFSGDLDLILENFRIKFVEPFDFIFDALRGIFSGFTNIFRGELGSILDPLGIIPDNLQEALDPLDVFSGDIETIFDNFQTKITEPFDALIVAFDPLISAIQTLTNSFTTSGGGAGFVGSLSQGDVKGAFDEARKGRFAVGGTVPNGFPGDNFPAFLQSGEMIVPRNDVTDLREFLAQERRGSGPLANMDETNALLAQIAGQGGSGGVVTLNEDGLTELLLDFSRRNERTVA